MPARACAGEDRTGHSLSAGRPQAHSEFWRASKNLWAPICDRVSNQVLTGDTSKALRKSLLFLKRVPIEEIMLIRPSMKGKVRVTVTQFGPEGWVHDVVAVSLGLSELRPSLWLLELLYGPPVRASCNVLRQGRLGAPPQPTVKRSQAVGHGTHHVSIPRVSFLWELDRGVSSVGQPC